MESIQKDSILELNPNIQHELRKQFDLHEPGVMDEMIENFRQWIRQQNHFIKKDFDTQYLENAIISAKGSIERAKKTLDKICTAKTLKPEYFKECDVKEFIHKVDFVMAIVLPKHTPDYYRVYFIKIVSSDFNSMGLMEYYKYVMLIMEYVKRHDRFMGMYCVVDLRNQNLLKMILNFDVLELKYLISLLLEGHGIRVKGIHLLSESKSVETAVAFTKQVVSSKLAQRIHAHRTLEDFHKYIPRDILPEDYGGLEKPYQNIYNDWVNVLGAKENVEYFKDVCQPGTDEALRSAVSYNESVLGMPGSFRKLRVD